MALYHPDAFDPGVPVDSHWAATAPPATHRFEPIQGLARAEVAVIGAGFTGLSAALRLASGHGADVCVVDAGAPGWGASGRNGGFCCLGGTRLSYSALLRRYGEPEARRVMTTMRDAVDHVGGVLERHGIDAERHGSGEICLAHRRNRLADLRAGARELERVLGVPARVLDAAELAGAGIGSASFHGGLLSPVGFGLHPLRYVRGLADAAAGAGARIHGQSRVTGWSHERGMHRLRFADEALLEAPRLLIATNGYGGEALLPWLAGRTLPVISSILVTRALEPAERAAAGFDTACMAYDSRHLLHYFRLLPDGRFLFGGRGGTDASPAGRDRVRRQLRGRFESAFPAWREVPTERCWSGLACLSAALVPFVGALPEVPGLWAALAWHGNGVAMGSWCGDRVGGLIAGDPDCEAALPGPLRAPPARFPLPVLRMLYLRAAYAAYTLRDEVL